VCQEEEELEAAGTSAGGSGFIKTKANTIGSKVDLELLRNSSMMDIMWYIRLVKQGRTSQVAPTRPGVSLKKSVTLMKHQVVRLL
jgi:hypothetical protein